MKKITFFLFLILNSSFLISQNADCDNMKVLKDSVYLARNMTGYGNKLEFSTNNADNSKIFEKETNSRWYLLTMPDSGVFTFDIKTLNKSNDWDFILYRYKNMFCKRIAANKISPIRSNLSRSSETGLSLTSKLKYVGPGINENYSKAVIVNKGEKLVLVINNPKKSNQGHTLILHYPRSKPEKKEVLKADDFPTINFILSIKDKATKKPVTSDVNITGFSKHSIFLTDITKYESPITKKNHHAEINVSAKGYLLYSEEIYVRIKEKEVLKDIFLEPIEIGKKINLKSIQFYGNRADFLPSANSSLKSLLSFLRLNKSVTIEIEGHVNGPGKPNTNDYKELSNNRAKAVKIYLIENGIDEKRMEFKGFGNSKMLYPTPKNAKQMSANRRVEIKILTK